MRPVGRATDGGTEETASKKPRVQKAVWLVSGQGRGQTCRAARAVSRARSHFTGGRAQARCTAYSPLPLGAEVVCGLGVPHAPPSQPASIGLSTQALGESRVTTASVPSRHLRQFQGVSSWDMARFPRQKGRDHGDEDDPGPTLPMSQGARRGGREGPRAVRSWNPRENRTPGGGAGSDEAPGLGAGVRVCHVEESAMEPVRGAMRRAACGPTETHEQVNVN